MATHRRGGEAGFGPARDLARVRKSLPGRQYARQSRGAAWPIWKPPLTGARRAVSWGPVVSFGWKWGLSMLFTGSYRRALDDKQRLPLPRPLRESDAAEVRLYLTPGLDGCLAVYPEQAFAALAERLAESSPAARDVRDYSRLFFSQAACVSPDRQWRVRVPPELCQWAGLAGEVMIVGVRDHLEIWAPARWDEYVSRCEPQYDQLAERALVAPLAAGRPRAETAPQAAAEQLAPPTQPR